jgi:DNA-directed RNA polymerase specialized sigma24 family protein
MRPTAAWWPMLRGPATVRHQPTTLEAILADEYGRLVRLAGVVCRDPADAQDAVQAHEAIRIDQRRRRWWSRLGSAPREIEVASGEGDPARPGAEANIALRDAFDRLPVEQRVVVALHHYAGYSVAEAAALVGIPLETARSRLRLARAHLRRVLDESTR